MAARCTRATFSGQIINVGSLAGLMGVPGQGFYSASKFALEGYTETLRIELGPFHIHVSLIEPGFFKTNLHSDMLLGSHLSRDYDGLRPGRDVGDQERHRQRR